MYRQGGAQGLGARVGGNLWYQNQQTMATTFNATFAKNYEEQRISVLSTFITWCKGQQEDRLLWLGIALAGHGCFLTPLTGMAVLMAGGNMILFALTIISMGLALISNLAAMPTKITIPVFVGSIVLDIAIIATCASMGFTTTNIF
jgi:hypothetical protein